MHHGDLEEDINALEEEDRDHPTIEYLSREDNEQDKIEARMHQQKKKNTFLIIVITIGKHTQHRIGSLPPSFKQLKNNKGQNRKYQCIHCVILLFFR